MWAESRLCQSGAAIQGSFYSSSNIRYRSPCMGPSTNCGMSWQQSNSRASLEKLFQVSNTETLSHSEGSWKGLLLKRTIYLHLPLHRKVWKQKLPKIKNYPSLILSLLRPVSQVTSFDQCTLQKSVKSAQYMTRQWEEQSKLSKIGLEVTSIWDYILEMESLSCIRFHEGQPNKMWK